MAERSEVFERTYRHYLDQVVDLDFGVIGPRLGLREEGDGVVVPFFRAPYRVTREGVRDAAGRRPPFPVCLVICKYLLMAPPPAAGGVEWVAYRDFKGSAPLHGYFSNNAERTVSDHFAGRADRLARAADRLGGRPPEEDFPYDVSRVFEILPELPALLLFNDGDAEFPAASSTLFQRRAERFLDMECLAIAGEMLAARLRKADEAVDSA